MTEGEQKYNEAMGAYNFLKRVAEEFSDDKRNFLMEIAGRALDEAGAAWMNDDYWHTDVPA